MRGKGTFSAREMATFLCNQYTQRGMHSSKVCVYVCVCVCIFACDKTRKRGRERKRDWEGKRERGGGQEKKTRETDRDLVRGKGAIGVSGHPHAKFLRNIRTTFLQVSKRCFLRVPLIHKYIYPHTQHMTHMYAYIYVSVCVCTCVCVKVCVSVCSGVRARVFNLYVCTCVCLYSGRAE